MPEKVKESRFDAHLVQISRRQLGYAFGGPDPKWCQPIPGAGMSLPVDPNKDAGDESEHQTFTGCFKYSTCSLISDEVRWKPWEKLTTEQQESLKKVRCYRATSKWWDPETKQLETRKRAGWDPNMVKSRRAGNGESEWIGNPFGIRTPEIGEIAREMQQGGFDTAEHRDLSPCPIGGCVTPEMERDYRWDSNYPEGIDWATAEVCPLFFRHVDNELVTATPNPQRFTQCYVTLTPVRELLSKAGIIAVAPIFRASQGTVSIGDAFWYPFYSGFSFLQLPTRAPNEKNWTDPTLQFRWQATTTVRQQTTRVFRTLPIHKLFEGVEKGELLSPWEKQAGIVSVSEGQASALLLQWLLISRLEEVIKDKTGHQVDIVSHCEWLYEAWSGRKGDRGICGKLFDLGYDIEREFNIKLRDNAAFRYSSLDEDLRLLGLVDTNGRPTERLKCCIFWLKEQCLQASLDRASGHNISNDLWSAAWEWLGPALPHVLQILARDGKLDKQQLWILCWLLIHAATSGLISLPDASNLSKFNLKKIAIHDSQALSRRLKEYKEGIFARICRLVPPVHVIVRANWSSPVRWIFLPIGEASQIIAEDDSGSLRAKVSSGLIILLEDDLHSLPYKPNLSEGEDNVLTRLWGMRRIISAVARIEEGHVRDDLILAKEWWDFQRPFAESVQHLIRTIRRVVELRGDASAEFVSRVLANLESLFLIPPEEHISEDLVAIDVKHAAQEAIDAFTALYQEVKGITFNLITYGDDFEASVRPLVSTYDGEDPESIKRRTSAGLLVLLLDVLAQRAAKKESWVSIHLDVAEGPPSRLIIDINLPSEFEEWQVWDSDNDSLNIWGRGRGFYTTFFTARAIGSKRQAVFNSETGGVIRLEFDRG